MWTGCRIGAFLIAVGCAQRPTEDTPIDAIDTAIGGLRLEGRLTDPSDQPLSDLVLQACALLCYVAITEADGSFAFAGLDPGPWSLKISSSDAGHSSAVIPLWLESDRVLSLSVPLLQPSVPVPEGGGPLSVADGLTLEASAEVLPGLASVAAAAIPAGRWPPLDGLGAEPVAGFYLSPLGGGRDVPFAIEAAGGRAWCTDREGVSWIRCDEAAQSGTISGRLPDLGTVIVTR